MLNRKLNQAIFIKINDAISHGDFEDFKSLSEQYEITGAELDELYKTNSSKGPINSLIQYGNATLDFAKHLVTMGCSVTPDSESEHPYDLALTELDFEIANFLLESGAEPISARKSQHEKVTHYTLSNVARSLPINEQIANVLKLILKKEIEAGWQLNIATGYGSLFLAAVFEVDKYPSYGSRPKGYFTRQFKTLLELGADYKITIITPDKDKGYLSCLSYFSDHHDAKQTVMEILEFLINEHGCEPLPGDYMHPFVSEFMNNKLSETASEAIANKSQKSSLRRL